MYSEYVFMEDLIRRDNLGMKSEEPKMTPHVGISKAVCRWFDLLG